MDIKTKTRKIVGKVFGKQQAIWVNTITFLPLRVNTMFAGRHCAYSKRICVTYMKTKSFAIESFVSWSVVSAEQRKKWFEITNAIWKSGCYTTHNKHRSVYGNNLYVYDILSMFSIHCWLQILFSLVFPLSFHLTQDCFQLLLAKSENPLFILKWSCTFWSSVWKNFYFGISISIASNSNKTKC